MEARKVLESLLNFPPNLPQHRNFENWHLDYGITNKRRDALIKDTQKDPNSCFNPLSETALTLFMLGNLDNWKQAGSINQENRPRTICGEWNSQFFNGIQSADGPKSILTNVEDREPPPWTKMKHNIFEQKWLDFNKSVMCFEFEVINKALGASKATNSTFREFSFLDLDKKTRKWSQFDALMFVPAASTTPDRPDGKGAIIGFEAKLSSDCSLRTSKHVYVNQIVRNLESGYWLVNHDDSRYKGWEFHYVFICPEECMTFNTTFYSYALNDIEKTLSNYWSSLKSKKADPRRVQEEERFQKFKKYASSSRNVTRMSWIDIARALHEHDETFWVNYFKRLDNFGVPSNQAAIATKERLILALGGHPLEKV